MIHYNGCLKVWFFYFGEQFFFSRAFSPTHLTNALSRDYVGPDAFTFPFCGKDIVLWLTSGYVCSLRRGDSTLLGPGPACAILRQFRSLRHHVGHRWEKRHGHRAPRTQVRLLLALCDTSQQPPSWGRAKAWGRMLVGPLHQKVQDRAIVTATSTPCAQRQVSIPASSQWECVWTLMRKMAMNK